MSSLKDAPIQRKLMNIILMTSGAVILLTCASFFVYEFLTFRQSTVLHTSTLGKIICTNCAASLAFENQKDANSFLSALKAEQHIVAAAIYDKHGKLFAQYPAQLALAEFPTVPEKDGYDFQNSHLSFFQPIIQDDQRLGTLYIKSNLTAIYERVKLYGFVVILVVVGTLLIAYALSRVLRQGISQPILALAETAKLISTHQNYSVRAPLAGKDEIGLLTDAFNQMLIRIDSQNRALRESEERLRAVLNSALSAVIVVDIQGRITDWNAQAETIFGWPRLEAIGQLLADLIVPVRNREAYERARQYYISTGLPAMDRPIEVSAVRRDGSEFPAELAISALKNVENITICGFITDITERRKVEETRTRLAAIVESSDDAIIGKTLEGVIATWNPAAQKIFGYSAEEAIGQFMLVLIPPERQQEEAEILDCIRRGESLYHFETVRIRKDGSRVDIAATISPIKDGQGRVIGASKIARDITERKLAEDKIQKLNQELELRVIERTAALESANKDLEAFSYSVSHDLRAPLRHIGGFAGILASHIADNLDEKGRHYLSVISNSVQRMNQLIDDLLIFSRLSQVELHNVPVDLTDLITDARLSVNADAQGRKVVWEVDTPGKILGDPSMLRQIFVNLLSNAVKYTRQQTEARIQVGLLPKTNGTTTIFIRDNGAGFDMRYVDKLFGVFQRLHNFSEFEGTGVGLAIVQRIVMRHGGRVWAEGKVNEGATFYVALPAGGLEADPILSHSGQASTFPS